MTPTREQLRQAWVDHRRKRDVHSANQILISIAGTKDLDSIPENMWQQCIVALQGTMKCDAPVTLESIAAWAWPRWNSAGKRKDA